MKLETPHVLLSFTSTFFAFADDKLDIEDIEASPAIIFGCAPVHLVRPDDTLPMECSWHTRADVEAAHDGDGCQRKDVSKFILDKWDSFLAAVVAADNEGTVEWSSPEGYHATCSRHLSEDRHVYWQGSNPPNSC